MVSLLYIGSLGLNPPVDIAAIAITKAKNPKKSMLNPRILQKMTNKLRDRALR